MLLVFLLNINLVSAYSFNYDIQDGWTPDTYNILYTADAGGNVAGLFNIYQDNVL